MRPDDALTSLTSLIEDALAPDEETAIEATMALQRQGDDATLKAMSALLDHPQARQRSLAAAVLGQLGPERVHAAECYTALAARLPIETDPAVLGDIGIALGHLRDPRAIALMAPHAKHPDPAVRYGVVMALMGQDDEQALSTLIKLSTDPDPEIRNWSTFALGTQTEIDTPTIREALAARLDDPDPDTRSEAMVGLAERDDPAAIPAVARALRAGPDRRAIEAAARLGDPSLHAPLEALRTHPDLTARYAEELDEAIARCDPEAEA